MNQAPGNSVKVSISLLILWVSFKLYDLSYYYIGCLRGYCDQVHQDLPALPLSDAVRERVERRLRALMQNDVPLPHKRVVPSVHTLAVRTQQSADRDAAAAEGESSGSAKKNKKIGGWQPAQLKPVYWDT
jgi:hypothetical protein